VGEGCERGRRSKMKKRKGKEIQEKKTTYKSLERLLVTLVSRLVVMLVS
jgi:hypothetical protein